MIGGSRRLAVETPLSRLQMSKPDLVWAQLSPLTCGKAIFARLVQRVLRTETTFKTHSFASFYRIKFLSRSVATKQSPARDVGDCFAPYGRSQ